MTVLALTTVPDRESGERIARALVEEGLAACVNICAPMTSIYRWRGVVEQTTEHQLVIKTVRQRVGALQARLAVLHPYELPEFLVIDVGGGNREYLAWISAQTDGSGGGAAR